MSARAVWSYPLAWPARTAAAANIHLVADEGARARISRFLDLPALARLEADIVVRPWLDGMALSGRITGVATRVCGVTLDHFDETIDASLDIHVVPAGSPNAPEPTGAEVVVDLESADPPDVADGPDVDVAGYVVEAVALALDPFPRKPGAVFEPPTDPTNLSPFAVLRKS